jgi:ubiquinone/menaquinone biosynthesis C-methylase UbiE
MTATLDHVNNPKLVFKEIHRILTFKGYLILLETVLKRKARSFYDETHMHHFTIMDIKRLLKHFKIEKVVTFYPILSQIHLDFMRKMMSSIPILEEMLSKIPGLIGSYFNYSEVLVICRKN